MPQDLFANLGIAGAALFIIYVMLKYFMNSLDRKDGQINTLIDDHNRAVDKFKRHIEICNSNFITLTKQATANSVHQTEVLNKIISRIDILVPSPVAIKQNSGDVIIQNK